MTHHCRLLPADPHATHCHTLHAAIKSLLTSVPRSRLEGIGWVFLAQVTGAEAVTRFARPQTPPRSRPHAAPVPRAPQAVPQAPARLERCGVFVKPRPWLMV